MGFDGSHTEEGAQAVRAIATRLSPALAAAPRLNVWAGLRPMTPDGQPIVGVDPEHDALVYDCGHSRNGVLLAPLTGRGAAALALDEDPGVELAPFHVARFAPASVD